MTKMYYVCNHVDKVEIQFSTSEAAAKGWRNAVYDMVAKNIHMFNMDFDYALAGAQGLFYVKEVDYVRQEVIYNAADLKGIDDEQH